MIYKIGEENKEQELLQRILSEDRSALKEFYTTFSPYLTTVCSRYIYDKDDIKDILQESFIKIFKSIASFEYKGVGSLRAWSTRIVVNESLKHLRSRNKLDLAIRPSWELPDMTDDEDLDFEEVPTDTILEMIRALPTGYRTVFNLYVFEEKSHREIALILNISENTSASQLHRAKSILAQQIRNYRSKKNMVYEQSMVR